MKRKLFRWAINITDRINVWFRDIFNIDPKRKVLEAKQDRLPIRELDATIGKALGAVESNSTECNL